MTQLKPGPPKKLLVAYDGLPSADPVVRFACELARAVGGELSLVHIVEQRMVQRVATALELPMDAAETYCVRRKRSLFERAGVIASEHGLRPDAEGEARFNTRLRVADKVVPGRVDHGRRAASPPSVSHDLPPNRTCTFRYASGSQGVLAKSG